MDTYELSSQLHLLERKVLPKIANNDSLQSLIKKTSLQEVEVSRALQWLEQKKLIVLDSNIEERIELGKNGKSYAKELLPEHRFLLAIKSGKKSLPEVQKAAKLESEELNISLGLLKRKAAINFDQGKLSLTDAGELLSKKDWPEELFLKKLPKLKKELSNDDKKIFDELLRRKEVLFVVEEKSISATLTELGKTIQKMKLDTNIANKITPEMLRTGSWKNQSFRPYQVKDPVAPLYPGKQHFVNQSIQYARRIWLDMGFKEMSGNMVQTTFWDLDALFVPQDHPARTMQDTFYLEHPKTGKLPDKKLVDAVRAAHEHGGKTGSKGWQYKWDEKESMKNLLRTHTTVLSARTLASLKKEDLPAKFFSVGRCFRNETLDWKHLFEFNQTDGIVADENANFRHLLGYLKQFMKKMGYDKIRFRPAYFPYTEPSVEFDVYHPTRKQWVELGGAGMFRPEVVTTLLGKDIPVLAWGPGFDRIMTEYYAITDLRDLYKNDIKQLREMKLWVK